MKSSINAPLIIKMLKDGMTARQIANKLGITYHAVYHLAKKENCNIPCGHIRVLSPRRDEARKMKQARMTYAEIGKVMGISRQRAQQLVSPNPKRRQQIVKNANGRCSKCGRKVKKLDAHHSNYSGDPDRVLCTPCHKNEDAKLGFAQITRWPLPTFPTVRPNKREKGKQ